MFRLILICLFSLTSLRADEKYLKREFHTDKCTGWINGVGDIYWGDCCVIHDLYMWGGGTSDHRDLADIKLRECIKEAGSSFHANLMYRVVRLGQYSPITFKSKRWGHAWPDEYRYQKLSGEDIIILSNHLENAQVPDIGSADFDRYILDLQELNQ